MARLTITLSDERHAALKEAAARRRRTIGLLIEESLEAYGIKTRRSAEKLVAAARRRSSLSEEQAMRLALRETRAVRRERRKRAG
ncbi:MAG TPA: CopG family transcriptional regulator [Thermoanaerobaculia bacterium]|nr:CopG family transcriptional regulator [Thermoanaerobaculia bacterium]